MRKILWILVIFTIFSSIEISANERHFSMVRIELGDNENQAIQKLGDLGADITYVNRKKGFIEAIIEDSHRIAIAKLGLTTSPIIDDLAAYTEQLRNEDYFEHFHTFAQMLEEMGQIVAEHPDIASLHDIGDSYNKVNDQGGYDILALKISDEVEIEDDSEAEALFMANMHAREIITPEIIMYFMHYLVDNYGTNGYVTHLVNNREIWLIPTFNPDGHEYVFTGDIAAVPPWRQSDPIWWRKNMRDNNNNGVFDHSYDGVDLNRNFGYMWGYDNGGSSPYPSNPTYRGPEQFSEPESQAIQYFVQEHDFIVSLCYHSYHPAWLYPWGYIDDYPPEPDISSFRALADSCTAYNGYVSGNSKDILYIVNGDTDDWLYGEHGIFAFTPEVGSSGQGMFWPDTNLIRPLILENLGPNLFMSYAAGEEPIVEHVCLPDFDNHIGPYPITVKITPPILLTEPVPLDSTSLKVYYNTSGKAPFDSVQLLPTGTPNLFAAEIPNSGFQGTIYYFVSAGDSIGRRGTSPRGAPMAVDSFLVAPDMIPPTIVHEPLRFQHPGLSKLKIFADITDNVGVFEVMLQFQQNAEPISEVPMALVNETMYEAVMDSIVITPGDSFKYRIIASDSSLNRNTAFLPEEGWYSFGIFKSDFLYDFEENAICSTHEGSDWEWGVPTAGPDNAYSGKNLWGTRLNTNYTNSSNSKLEVPEYVLNPDFQEAAFQFWHWYQTELSQGSIWDGGNVKISIDDGAYEVIASRRGYDGLIDPYNDIVGGEQGFGGPAEGNPGWQSEIIDLTEYIGHSIKLRFHFGSDDNTPDFGWYVDDMEFLVFPQIETTVATDELALPQCLELGQNYPNPFNSRTKLEYHVPKNSNLRIEIYNQIGQRVRILYEGRKSSGRYMLEWDGKTDLKSPAVSGIYFCILKVGSERVVRKMVYLR